MESRSIGMTEKRRTLGRPLVERIEGFFVRHRERFWRVHLVVFLLMVALVVVPAFLPLPEEEATIFDNISLFANFVIWAVWFPLLFLSVILSGRLWCGVLCPQGAASEYAGRRGLDFAPPRWLRKDWIAIASFIVITIFGQVVGVRDYPLATLEVLGGTTILAVVVGYVYASGRRVWCRYLCPMGPLLGVLSRFGAIGFERACRSSRGYPCPTFINTATKASSANCIECFRCVRPGEKGSLRLEIRRPGREVEEIARREPNPWEVVFLLSATGLALGAFYWQVSPLYIGLKHAIGDMFLNMGLLHIVGGPGPRWLVVNWPEAGEVFLYLDAISITIFMVGSMLAVMAALSGLTLLAVLPGRPRGSVFEGFTVTGYAYGPVALLSLVLGLGQPLFQSMVSMGVSAQFVSLVEMALFAAGGLWSIYLAGRITRGNPVAMVPVALGIGLVATLWYRVLF